MHIRYRKIIGVDWAVAFKGFKKHQPNYEIVIHGVLTAEPDSAKLTDAKIIERLEKENNMRPGAITKTTSLRRRRNNDEVKLHHSVILYTNDRHAANKCITNGCYIEYLHYAAERFTPQHQIMQCFNCCDYGHRPV